MLTPLQIATATGCSPDNIAQVWPLQVAALQEWDIYSASVEIAAAATIATETPAFWPIREKYDPRLGAPAYFAKMYWDNLRVRHYLGNLTPKDAITYFGRGLIQVTGKDNYDLYGDLCHLDLANYPDLALLPENATSILAAFFSRNHIATAADGGDWKRVRLRVNGGLNGWERFASVVKALGGNVVI